MKDLKVGQRVSVNSNNLYIKHLETKAIIIESKWNLYKIKFDNGEMEWVLKTKVTKLD